ncbi:MAG: PHB accumulation regulatory domain-containing protein, partial [Brachymonas sp.]
ETVLANLIRFYGHTMQGFFGASLESNIQAFADMQKKVMEMAPGFGGRDAWQKMMHMPMQGMQQMQDQMQRQYQKSLQQWLAAFQPKR